MDFNEKKKKIKIFVSDFDGVFTDGKLTVYSDGRTSKQLDYRDIMAIANLIKNGIKVVIISGEKSEAIEVLKQKFSEIEVYQDIRNKKEILDKLLENNGLSYENVLYIGDDINDIKCLSCASIACSVANAHREVKTIDNIYIASRNGGDGAVREIADLIT